MSIPRSRSVGSESEQLSRLAQGDKSSDEDKSEKKTSRAQKLKRTLSGRLIKEKASRIEKPVADVTVDDTLHKALRGGISVNKLKRLIKRTPNINQVNEDQQTVLHLAAAQGLSEHIELLLSRGADINRQDERGFTPLHYCALEKQLSCCKVLLEKDNIDVTITNKQKTTVLHYLVRVPVDEDNAVFYRKVMDMVIDKGIDVNLANNQGESALHSAILASNRHATAFLLERGADANLRSLHGETPLHYATRTGNVKLVRMLMEVGADATVTCKNKNTPIDVAEQYQATDVQECLLAIISGELESDKRERVRGSVHDVEDVANVELRAVKTKQRLKEGYVELFSSSIWSKRYAILYPDMVIFFADNTCSVDMDYVSLTEAKVQLEEGTTFNSQSEVVWCFTFLQVARSISIAFNDEGVRDEWYQAIMSAFNYLGRLKLVYKQLQKMESPRKAKRKQYRKATRNNLLEGTMMYHYSLKKGVPDRELMQILLENPAPATACLSEVVDVDNADFFFHLCRFCMHHDKLSEVINAALTYQIHKTTTGETLFREMSFGSRLLSTYLELEAGKKYLKLALHSLVNSVAKIDLGSLEVNPSNVDNRVDISENLSKVFALSQAFLDHILNTGNQCPLLFREALAHTKQQVDEVYPNMTNAVVGGLMFLRYLCPAIVSPQKFALLPRAPDPTKQRALILISKLLQSVSNGVEFDGSKEDYTQKLNPFIKRNRLYVDVFFDNLTRPDSIAKQREEQQQARKPLQKKLGRDDLEHSTVVTANYIRHLKDRIHTIMQQNTDKYDEEEEEEDPCEEDSP
mmetsp:Transcript_19695/g.75550  ORF Transcript_19695/g.75550 Transcript_19695/m.75550 type:complete len:805 (-) Transcript_19695:72-2486(-)